MKEGKLIFIGFGVVILSLILIVGCRYIEQAYIKEAKTVMQHIVREQQGLRYLKGRYALDWDELAAAPEVDNIERDGERLTLRARNYSFRMDPYGISAHRMAGDTWLYTLYLDYEDKRIVCLHYDQYNTLVRNCVHIGQDFHVDEYHYDDKYYNRYDEYRYGENIRYSDGRYSYKS